MGRFYRGVLVAESHLYHEVTRPRRHQANYHQGSAMVALKYISSDSHVREDDDFKNMVPIEYRHRLPHKEKINGADYSVVEGRKKRRSDLAESRINDDNLNRQFRSDPTGGRDISRRLEDHARDNVVGEVIYPDGMLALMASPDISFQMGVAKAYNDWVHGIFGKHPGKFAPAAILPTKDVPMAVEEVIRLKGMGFRVVSCPISVGDQAYRLPVYEPLWSILEETGMVPSFHIFTGTKDHLPEGAGDEDYGGILSYMIEAMAEAIQPTAQLLSSGVPMRHPDMNFVMVECGGGWLAWVLYALDEQYERKHMWIEPKLDMKPSEYFKRQGHVTFGDDPVALTNLEYTGEGALLWGSDYPHDEGTFPHSEAVIDRIFQGLSEETKRKIVFENASNLYGFF